MFIVVYLCGVCFFRFLYNLVNNGSVGIALLYTLSGTKKSNDGKNTRSHAVATSTATPDISTNKYVTSDNTNSNTDEGV